MPIGPPMHRRLTVLGTGLLLPALLALGSAAPAATPVGSGGGDSLRAFGSEAALESALRRWIRRTNRPARSGGHSLAMPTPVKGLDGPAAAAPPADAAAAESVTNVQEAGVDEGGIVKVHGRHLVILRRGRLFTVRIAGDTLQPVAAVNAYAPGLDPSGDWLDELLIAGDTAVVIGYSDARGGTEVSRFQLSPDGGIRYIDTIQLRSNDYYSSRNYASRLIGDRLIFYTPLRLSPWIEDPWAGFPAMRRWSGLGAPPPFRRIAPATRIYRTDTPLEPGAGLTLHTVTTCTLGRPELDCRSTAVMGSEGRVFTVSPTAVYVWTAGSSGGRDPGEASLFRLPLDGGAPAGLKTRGAPIDQLSFREDGSRNLHVLVSEDGGGEGMWRGERSAPRLALLRVAPGDFGDGSGSASWRAYRPLPGMPSGALQNRHIGPWLLYGAGAGWEQPAAGPFPPLVAVRVDGGPVQRLPLGHGVDRLEALAGDGLAVGSNGRDLLFTTLRLGSAAVAVDRFRQSDAAQGETRTHGFFYKPDGNGEGWLGLPIVAGDGAAASSLEQPGASVLFLRNRELRLTPWGTLSATPGVGQRDDGCRVSCVDWYGNSRPLFLQGRVFALMGYEIVEGSPDAGRIRERRRVNIAPVGAAQR
jgi:hypothetical protein